MNLSSTIIYYIMDLKYQLTIAVSSCFIGLLAGIFIIRIARRTSRRKSPFDNSSNDDVSTEGRRLSYLDYRRSSRELDHRYMRQPNDEVSTRTHVEFETFSYPKSKHNNLPTSDDSVYNTVSNDMTTQLTVDPPADYPVTPVISRQVSMPVCPVTIPQADYSDDETLVDYPITRSADTNASGKPQAAKHHHLKRTTSYPVMNYTGRNPVTRRSERHHVTRYSDSQHDMVLPNTELFTDSRFQTQTGHLVTNPPPDTHVNIQEHHEAAPLPDYPRFDPVENVPLPDYY